MKQAEAGIMELLNVFPKDKILKVFLAGEPLYYGDVLKKTSISPMLGMRHISELKSAGILTKLKGSAKLVLNEEYSEIVRSMVH